MMAQTAAAPAYSRGPSATGGRRFNQLPNALIAAVGGTAYRVAAVLAANADRDTGECFLKVRSIAAQLGGCSDRTVQRALRELEAAGYLVTTPWFDKPGADSSARKHRDESGRQGTNIYRLCPEALGAAVIPLPSKPRQAAESASDQDVSVTPPVTQLTPRDPESVDPEQPPLPPLPPLRAVPSPPALNNGGGGDDAVNDDGEALLDALSATLELGEDQRRRFDHARDRRTPAIHRLGLGGAERLAAGWGASDLASELVTSRDLAEVSHLDAVLASRLDAVPLAPPAREEHARCGGRTTWVELDGDDALVCSCWRLPEPLHPAPLVVAVRA